MSYSQNPANVNSIESFKCSMPTSKMNNTEPSAEINNTRGGYFYKIINNLLTSCPSVFAPYLLNNEHFKQALIQNIQCKSIALLMITLITLPQQNPVNTSQMKKYLESCEQTREQRAEIFGEVAKRCVQTTDDSEMEDTHTNLCYVINSMFLREFNNQKTWVVLIFEEYLDQLIESYLKNEEGNIGNKLGIVIYSIVDTMLNKTANMEIQVSIKVWGVVRKFVRQMIQFLVLQTKTYWEITW